MGTPPIDSTRPGPVRTCVGCRERALRSELMRVVAGSDAHGPAVVPDPRGTAPGRGAHLHPTAECLDLAVRRRVFPRALRHQGGLDTTGLRAAVERTDPHGHRPKQDPTEATPTRTGARSS